MGKAYKCPGCGNRVDDTMPVCPKCGKKFAWGRVKTKGKSTEVSKGLKQCNPWLYKNRFSIKTLSYIFPIVPIVCVFVFKNYKHSKDKAYQKAYKDTVRWAITSLIGWTIFLIILFIKIIQGVRDLDMHTYY